MTTLPDGNRYDNINDILNLLRRFSSQHWKVSSSQSEDLNNGIKYSRAMYNLESLIEFPDNDDDDDEDDDETVEVTSLTSFQRNNAYEYLQLHAQNCQGVFTSINDYLNHYSELFSLKPIHLLALNIVREKLLSGDSNFDFDNKFRPEWADIEAAHSIQLLCKMFLSYTRKNGIPLHQDDFPSFLFDGYLFHRAIFELSSSFDYDDPPQIPVVPIQTDSDYDDTHQMPAVPIQMDVETNARVVLPIDQYRDLILDKINQDRVVIIHGETGSGKSSRLPVMLLENADLKGQECKIMISQPRYYYYYY
jgi:hypothetical protein